MISDLMKTFIYFIHEREEIRKKKEAGKKGPWTKDEILGQYRFCNVNREHDRVTKWIDKHIRMEHANDPDLWFALIVARLINQPRTLSRIYGVMDGSYDASWDKNWFIKSTDPAYWEKPIFNAAYIVSTNGMTKQKNLYVAENVLGPIWTKRNQTPPPGRNECRKWADWLLQFQGMGDFMVNQIVTDYKYTDICIDADDWKSFVMAGPGTKRGINRLYGNDKNTALTREDAALELREIRDKIKPRCSKEINEHFNDLNNLSNCFCEYDKYMRALTGDGRPKQKYKVHV